MTHPELIRPYRHYYVSMRVLGLSIFITMLITALVILLPLGLLGRLTDQVSNPSTNQSHSKLDGYYTDMPSEMKWSEFQLTSVLLSPNHEWMVRWVDGQLMVINIHDPSTLFHIMPTEAWSSLTDSGSLVRSMRHGATWSTTYNQATSWESFSEPPNVDPSMALTVRVSDEGIFRVYHREEITFQMPLYNTWSVESQKMKKINAPDSYADRVIAIPGGCIQMGLIWDKGFSYFQIVGPGWRWRYPASIQAIELNGITGDISLVTQDNVSVKWYQLPTNLAIPSTVETLQWTLLEGAQTHLGGNLAQNEIQMALYGDNQLLFSIIASNLMI